MRLTLALLVAGCQPGLQDPTFPTGSSTIVSHGRSLYSVNAWDGTLVRVDPKDERQEVLEIGGEPTRIAKVGDELWVTLRAERKVAVYRVQESGLPTEEAQITVGAEPYGIVASEDGERVYVALSQEDAVIEVNAADREVMRRWEVHNEPRWLALHPSGRALFVIYGFDLPITRIDLRSGEQSTIRPPDTEVPRTNDEDTPLNGRPTGDPAISSLGDVLVMPTLYVDNGSAGEQPTVVGEVIESPPVPYYTSENGGLGLQLSISRFNPALVGVPLDKATGEPLENDDTLAFFVGGFDGDSNPVRGYISSVTFDPDGDIVYAAMESADAVAMVDLRPAKGQGLHPSMTNGSTTFSTTGGSQRPPASGGFYERPQLIINVAGNPTGVAVGEGGQLWVHERGGRNLSWFTTSTFQTRLAEVSDGSVVLSRNTPKGRLSAGKSLLPAEIEAGREMFYSATDSRMAAPGAGVSCSTCHFDSRNDGLTWTFDNNPRQTPSLAGPVGETAPVTWTLDVASVALEARVTSEGRMGGGGLHASEAAAVEAFINWTRDVDTRDKGRLDDLVSRGAELFHSPEVGCAECHNGPRMTDNGFHSMFGLDDVNTPALVGIDATPPYLHDGSAATLRDVLERARNGEMGSTAGLSDQDMRALEAYLKSL
jgi:cytochrome c553